MVFLLDIYIRKRHCERFVDDDPQAACRLEAHIKIIS
jgi:hypothetical protein